jgi:hypothetical protein
MNNDVLSLSQGMIRSMDSNSLLRMYDSANAIVHMSTVQQERTRAGKASQRIAKELQRRKISM